MKIKINNEYEFQILNELTIEELYAQILNKAEYYKLIIEALENYERNYIDFNCIQIVKSELILNLNIIIIKVKINNLLSYHQIPYYKIITISFY